MKYVFICEAGHTTVRERGDYRMCEDCGEIVYCWQELSEKEPDNIMTESRRAIMSCGKLLDEALSEVDSIWDDNNPTLQTEVEKLKKVIGRALNQVFFVKEEL